MWDWRYNCIFKSRLGLNWLTHSGGYHITPAKKHSNYQHYHSIWLSKLSTWKQTNVPTHINDVSKSGRIDEIKLLKIWRELHGVDFPSIYLEYLLIKNILSGKSKGVDYLESNFWHVIKELAKDTNNPLNARIVDPANTANILSDLLTTAEKDKIKRMAVAESWRTMQRDIHH